jgi:capsular exopolysaccharide synthesis family protein
VRPAILSTRPINPPQALPKAAVGLVIGVLMGLVLAFVVEALDTSIGAIDDVEAFLESPVLGVIPHLDIRGELSEERADAPILDKETEEKYAFLISLFLPDSRPVEAIRALRTNLLFAGLEHDVRTIMVTSATPMEGKTTVAINLAIVLAQLGKRTLLVEADLRNPFLHHAFGISKEPGFTDVVIGSIRLEEAMLTFSDFVLGKAGLESLIDRPGIDNLFLLPSGHQPPNPTEFLSAQAVSNFLADVRQRFDYVVLDCAPILPVADPTILGARVDGTLVVVRVGSVARAALRRAKALLEATHARILGVCLTGVKAEVSPDYADMGYYRYRSGARERTRAARAERLALAPRKVSGPLVALVILLALLLALGVVVWTRPPGTLSVPQLPFRLPFLVGALGWLRPG